MRYKKTLGLFVILFGIMLFTGGVFAAATWTSPDIAHASREVTCNPACTSAQAIDGVFTSQWYAQVQSYPQWIYVDLESEKSVSGVRLWLRTENYGSFGYNVNIQVSSTGNNDDWQTVHGPWALSVNLNWNIANFDSVNARYVRVYYNSGSVEAALREFEVLVDDANSASSSCSGEFTYIRPDAVKCSAVWKNDGFYSCLNIIGALTRWWLSDTTPTDEWVYGDLEEEKCISNVRVYVKCPVGGLTNCNTWMPMNVDVQTTNDPSDVNSWTTVVNDFEIGLRNTWIESPDFNSNARYVRLYLNSGANGMVISRYEIKTASGAGCTPDDVSITCGETLCGSEINNCGDSVTCDFCNNSLYCDGEETCVAGSCVVGTPACDDGKTCTTSDICDEDSNSCTYTRDHTLCDDSNQCTLDNCDPLDLNADEITGCFSVIDNSCPIVGGVFWSDMGGEIPISITNIRDRVKLVVVGSNFLGKNVKYEIIKDGWLFFDTTILSENSDRGFITWKAGEVSVDNFEPGEYTFKATIVETGDFEESEILTVSNSVENTAPIAQIISPDTGEIYLTETNIEFRQNSYDPDDFFDYTWDIDGEIREGSSRDFVNYEFDYSYSELGQKRILLSVVDERSLSDSDFKSILIIDPSVSGKFVFSGITSPILNSEAINPVEMDGSDSYAIEVSNPGGSSGPVINCIAGKCPCSVIGPEGLNIDVLGCLIVDYNNLIFNWKFDSGEDGEVTVNGLTKYLKTFATLGWHDAELKVSLESGEESTTSTRFRITNIPPNENGCLQDTKTQYREVSGGIITMYDTRQPNDRCKGDDGDPLTGDDCCPNGYSCESDGSGFKCEASTLDQDIRSCEDYTVYGKDVCEGDIYGVGTRGSGGESCGKYINNICGLSSSGVKPEDGCECYWTSGGDCKQRGEIGIVYNNINLGSLTCELQSSDVGDCIDGVMTVSETSNIDWSNINVIANKLKDNNHITDINDAQNWIETQCTFDDSCISETRNILCGSVTNKIDFFNYWNFIITFLIIGFIYLFINIYLKKQEIDN
ncbi:discoidin domain-containing protein [Candidatus Pacearchaeota archaeon]|nr:discoidin domain-containing protein [Candidatus Pacearchaeota archaeon]